MKKASTSNKETANLPGDPTASQRKQDHIELAFQSQVGSNDLDSRFYYEPMLSAHPDTGSLSPIELFDKSLRAPIWVSSMTGGTGIARIINQNLARACRDFGLGMGLGSCRSILRSDEYIHDFAVRKILGDQQPLFANLGVAQIENLQRSGETHLITELIDRLEADGLIVHVNPLQEWFQPEGDHFQRSPIATIEQLLDQISCPIMVKEVGQGMGYESLKALFKLPLAAVDFAASGGTNFSKLELLRSDPVQQKIYQQIALVGHSAEEMVDMTNAITAELGDRMKCRQVIISGGVRDFLHGYYLINKLALPSIYGQASAFLRHARGSYEALEQHIQTQIRGLELANAFLKVK